MVFYFAWCDANETFSAAHMREDEIVFSFDLAHQEGQIPTLSVDVKNPHIGLLAPGRKQWAWLSYQSVGGVVPLFYGRLVGLPSNLFGEVVTLEFLARPGDYLSQKQTIGNSLMVEPYYDQIWIDDSKWGDPDTVLETYAMQWHVDRTSLQVSISDILFGEDGTEEFLSGDAFYDSVEIAFAQSPQTQVVCDATVQWTQASVGYITMPAVAITAWNGDQITRDWPKPEERLDGGWSVYDAKITNWTDTSAASSNSPYIITVGGTPQQNVNAPPPNPGAAGAIAAPAGVQSQIPSSSPTGGGSLSLSVSFHDEDDDHHDGDIIGFSESVSYDGNGGLGGAVTSRSISISKVDGRISSFSLSKSYASDGASQKAPSTTPPITVTVDGNDVETPVSTPSLFGEMILKYELSFPRTETLHFIMTSQVQPIVLLPPDEPVNQIKLSMQGSDVGLPIDPGGAMPIGDPGRSAFFPTDRGLQAVQYPMLVARAHLMQSARAAKINFDCTFERALELSCRKNAMLHDPRLPGGAVTGKITEYHLKCDGDSGTMIGEVQIETTIGTGLPITIRTGDPIYVDEGYVHVGYQFYSDADLGLPSGDASITMPSTYFDPTQMVLPLTFQTAVLAFQMHEGTSVDVVTAGGQGATVDPTWLEIVLIPVTGQRYQRDYYLGDSTLVMPKLIDLAAPYA